MLKWGCMVVTLRVLLDTKFRRLPVVDQEGKLVSKQVPDL
jgi:CBS domain-containing protein